MSASLVKCQRVRNGQPARVEFTASYQDLGPAYGLPWLFLFSEWSVRKADWRTRDAYRVEEIPAGGGRAFLLHRSADAIARDQAKARTGDPEVPTRYGCFLANEQDTLCECPGHAARGYCKHVDALISLLAAGHIDHPLDRPSDEVLALHAAARATPTVPALNEAPFA